MRLAEAPVTGAVGSAGGAGSGGSSGHWTVPPTFAQSGSAVVIPPVPVSLMMIVLSLTAIET
jgi:hypothetical protein